MRSFVARGRSLKEVAHLKLDPPGKESRPRPRRGKAEAVKTDATPSKEMGAKPFPCLKKHARTKSPRTPKEVAGVEADQEGYGVYDP